MAEQGKRIRITSIEKTARVAVIECDITFVSRVIKAATIMKQLEPRTKEMSAAHLIMSGEAVDALYNSYVFPLLRELEEALLEG